MAKTIVINVPTVKIDRLYRKRYVRHKKYYVHDEAETAGLGDMVKIRADIPRSKLKRRVLVDVVQKAPS